MASKVYVPDEAVDMKLMKRPLRATAVDLVPLDPFDDQDWRNSNIRSLNKPSSTMAAKDLKDLC